MFGTALALALALSLSLAIKLFLCVNRNGAPKGQAQTDGPRHAVALSPIKWYACVATLLYMRCVRRLLHLIGEATFMQQLAPGTLDSGRRWTGPTQFSHSGSLKEN